MLEFYTLDLKEDQKLIEEYDYWHKRVWPEILEGIKQVGISCMRLYRWKTRLVMMVEFGNDIIPEIAFEQLKRLPRQNEWEEFMWRFQSPLEPNSKWLKMDNIFEFVS
jgi:L-rhamnose mutarotase